MPRPTLTLTEARRQLSASTSKFSRKEWACTVQSCERACLALEKGDFGSADILLRRLIDLVRPHDGTDGVQKVAVEVADACRERVLRAYGGGMARSSKDPYLLLADETTVPDFDSAPPWRNTVSGKG